MNFLGFFKSSACALACTAWLSPLAFAGIAVVNGNGNTGFGGTVGQGTLTLSDDGITLSGSFARGPGTLNDALVLYFDTNQGASGFADTSSFTDNGDPLRTAISGWDGSNRTTATFASGFLADYVIAFDQGFGGLWQLVSGGSHNYVDSVNLSPTGDSAAASHSFSINLGALGVSGGDEIRFVATYIAGSAWRSNEAFGDIGFVPDNPGNTGNITFGDYYSLTTVPEPSSALLVMGGIFLATIRRRHWV